MLFCRDLHLEAITVCETEYPAEDITRCCLFGIIYCGQLKFPKWHIQWQAANIKHVEYSLRARLGCSGTAGWRQGPAKLTSSQFGLTHLRLSNCVCKWAGSFYLCCIQIKSGLQGVVRRPLWLDRRLPGKVKTKWPLPVWDKHGCTSPHWMYLPHDWKCG